MRLKIIFIILTLHISVPCFANNALSINDFGIYLYDEHFLLGELSTTYEMILLKHEARGPENSSYNRRAYFCNDLEIRFSNVTNIITGILINNPNVMTFRGVSIGDSKSLVSETYRSCTDVDQRYESDEFFGYDLEYYNEHDGFSVDIDNGYNQGNIDLYTIIFLFDKNENVSQIIITIAIDD